MPTIGGMIVVLAIVIVWGLIAVGFSYLVGGAARLGGPDDPEK